MDRQTYLLMNRWIDEEIDIHRDGNKWRKVQTDRITNARMDKKTEDRLIVIQLDRIGKPRGRKTNRQTDRRTYRQTDRLG
jgi:hypothetical protein